jgi:hypothetical protein
MPLDSGTPVARIDVIARALPLVGRLVALSPSLLMALLMALLSALLLTLSAAPALAQPAYVAPDNRTVRTFLEGKPGQVNMKVVRVENLSTVPIVVTQVVLLNCSNVSYVCGENAMEVTVDPGKRKTVLEVEAANISQPVNFSYRFRWRHKTRDAVLGALASGGDSAAAERLARMQRVETEFAATSREGEKSLSSQDVMALGDRIAALVADPDSIRIPAGGAITTTMLRIIAVDSAGASLGRLRASFGYSLTRGPAVSVARGDSLLGVATGRQVLTVRFAPALSAGRTTPFGELRFTLIVP